MHDDHCKTTDGERRESHWKGVALALGVPRSTLPADTVPVIGEQSPSPPLRTFAPTYVPLTDDEWVVIASAMPPPPIAKAEVDARNRVFINSCLWWNAARKRGASWGRLPKELGPPTSREGRYRRWVMLGLWNDFHTAIAGDERLTAERRHQFRELFEDSITRRARLEASRKRAVGQ